ncbi:hypothetical protein Misp02_14400 [Microtetraspora sp. NBRC 16547]|nr:hypothetical protein Misp02_14400 [Microtetraspora sp. NBRC 16547]
MRQHEGQRSEKKGGWRRLPGHGESRARTLMNVKKLLTYAAVAFVVFYLFTQPAGAAAAVKGVFGSIGTGAEQLSAFFTSLFSG